MDVKTRQRLKVYRAIDNDYRLNVLTRLHDEPDIAFNDLAKKVRIDRALLAYHVGVLKDVGLIKSKYEIQQYILTDSEIKSFFNKKAQTDENVCNWKEYTIYKLTQVLRKILIEAGTLKKNHNYELIIPYISEDLKKFFIKRNASIFLGSIGIKIYK